MYFRHQTSPADEPNRTVAYVSKIRQKNDLFWAEKFIFGALLIKLNSVIFHVKYQWDLFFAILNSILTPVDKKLEKLAFLYFSFFCSFFSNIFFIFQVWKFFVIKITQQLLNCTLNTLFCQVLMKKLGFRTILLRRNCPPAESLCPP